MSNIVLTSCKEWRHWDCFIIVIFLCSPDQYRNYLLLHIFTTKTFYILILVDLYIVLVLYLHFFIVIYIYIFNKMVPAVVCLSWGLGTVAGFVADFSFQYLASVKPYRVRVHATNCILAYPQWNRRTHSK